MQLAGSRVLPVGLIVVAIGGCCVLGSGCGSDPSGYTPEERAAQLVAGREKIDGHPVPESTIKCVFESDAGNGRAWYICQPREYHIACDKRTTDKPLTGPMESKWDWGDCSID